MASEARYHELFNTMIAGCALHELVLDEAGRPVDYVFLDVNPAFCTLTGLKREEVLGRRVLEVLPGMEASWIDRFGQVVLSRQPASFTDYAAALGRHYAVTAFPTHDRQFFVNFLDVTESHAAQERLRLQAAALESSANGIMIVDASGIITWVNRAFTRLTGWSPDEACGKNPRILKSGRHKEEFYRDLWATVTAGRLWRGELVNSRKDGSLYLEEMIITPVLDATGRPIHFVAIKQDITEQRSLREQLIAAQKMESIGRLAGGVAHDFNNLLQAITGFSSILLDELPADSPHRQDVLEIERAAKRAADVTRQLLAFSRRQMIEPKIVDLNTLVEGMRTMLQRMLGEDIHLVIEAGANLPPVKVDPGQMEQVLLNLAVNARDAMPQGGRLVIHTSDLVLLEEDTLFVPESRHGYFVCLAMTDTGHGMPRDIVEHIFEPFFSTKGPGKGTGLGLSVVYGIIQQHEGMVHVYSEPGQGSTFRLYLPAQPNQSLTPREQQADREPPPRGHGERILLVEDEDGPREIATRTLRQHGYQVTPSLNAAQALERLQAMDAFDLLFTDVVLPDQNGLDLALAARAKQPGLRLLFCSGYMDEKARWPAIREAGHPFLQKPYPLRDLLRTVHETLQAPLTG